MKKYITIVAIILAMTIASFAEENRAEKKDAVHLIPLLQYDYLSLDEQEIKSSSAGLIIQSDDVMFVGIYTRHFYQDDLLFDYPKDYHTIDTLLDGKYGRHQYIGIFKSESDKPVSGGLSTYQAAAVYGYELIHGGNLSLVLGGGLALGDFGIEDSEGDPWPVIPVPLVRMNYNSRFISTKFEFLTGPNFSFTVAPQSKVRLRGDFRMDNSRDVRDIIFEVALAWRFFSPESEIGDFAGVALGFKNDNYGAFMIGDTDGDESVESHYYAIFAELDLSLLKITGGYAFEGRELYREEIKRDTGEGYFVSVQGLYQF